MKIVISIFSLPQEIDELERTLLQLKKASKYITNNINWIIDVTMTVSNDIVDWNKSKIPKSFFETKLSKLSKINDWCKSNFRVSDEIKGCVSQRRFTYKEYKNADFFIWLDNDIIFGIETLYYIEESILSIYENNKYFVLTPEIVRIWDGTWDILVNKNYLNKPLNYHLNCDPYIESGVVDDISVKEIKNNIPLQPTLKFAGGWFTCLSGELIRKIGVPDSFGHYGLEDTFIMWASEKLMNSKSIDVKQFKIENLIVCEDYRYRNNKHYNDNLHIINRKDEFRKIAEQNFKKELDNI